MDIIWLLFWFLLLLFLDFGFSVLEDCLLLCCLLIVLFDLLFSALHLLLIGGALSFRPGVFTDTGGSRCYILGNRRRI